MNYPGFVIKKGAKGSAVRALQEKLSIDVDGDFGKLTQAAVKQYQSRHVDSLGRPLLVDGEVGELTWSALFGSEKATPSSVALAIISQARKYVGIKELPGNRGINIDRFNTLVGVPLGSAWCGSFNYTVFDEVYHYTFVKGSNPLPHKITASTSALYNWAKKHKKLITVPEPGCIFMVKGGKTGHLHQGIVTSVNGGYFETIEGNTNNDGSAEGKYCLERTRKTNSCHFLKVV